MVEVLFQVRKDKFKDNPIIPEGLDLVEEEDIITHRISLDDKVDEQRMLSECTVSPSIALPLILTDILGLTRCLQIRS